MGPIGCPETSVRNYQSTLRNNPEERRSNLHRGESVKSFIATNENSSHEVIKVKWKCEGQPGRGHFRSLCRKNSLTWHRKYWPTMTNNYVKIYVPHYNLTSLFFRMGAERGLVSWGENTYTVWERGNGMDKKPANLAARGAPWVRGTPKCKNYKFLRVLSYWILFWQTAIFWIPAKSGR